MYTLSKPHENARARFQHAGMRHETLVVRSHPFGALIDAQTRHVFIEALPEGYEYDICLAIKYLLKG